MAKIEVNKVELVWPGKYNEDGALKEVPRFSTHKDGRITLST